MFKTQLIILITISLSFVSFSQSQSKEINTPTFVSPKIIRVTISDTAKDPLNKIFKLYQNEKTEAKEVTRIKLELTCDAYVVLNVIDSNGKIIENLIDGEMTSGLYSVHFKSPNPTIMDELSYEIEVNGVSEVMKMIRP